MDQSWKKKQCSMCRRQIRIFKIYSLWMWSTEILSLDWLKSVLVVRLLTALLELDLIVRLVKLQIIINARKSAVVNHSMCERTKPQETINRTSTINDKWQLFQRIISIFFAKAEKNIISTCVWNFSKKTYTFRLIYTMLINLIDRFVFGRLFTFPSLLAWMPAS